MGKKDCSSAATTTTTTPKVPRWWPLAPSSATEVPWWQKVQLGQNTLPPLFPSSGNVVKPVPIRPVVRKVAGENSISLDTTWLVLQLLEGERHHRRRRVNGWSLRADIGVALLMVAQGLHVNLGRNVSPTGKESCQVCNSINSWLFCLRITLNA